MANNFYNGKEGRYPVKPVTIETVDGAVFDFLDKKVAPTVEMPNEGQPHKVAVHFAAGERWALLRKNGFRDNHGTLILPIISIRRTDIDREEYLGGMTSAQRSITISKVIHPKTSVIQNAVDARKRRGVFFQPKREPVIETLTIPFPDFSQISYEITIWTSYMTHMNEILEKLFYTYEKSVGGRVDSFVMPAEYDGTEPKGDSYYFVGFLEGGFSKQSNDDNFTDQEGIVKYVYNVKVPAYLMLNPADEALSYGEDEEGRKQVYKTQSVNKIKLKEEVISFEEFEKLFG
jgi:hypothetical protein